MILNLFFIVLPFIVLFIVMRRFGYKSNNTYERKPKKELFVPMLISLFIFITADMLLMDFWLSGNIRGILLRIFTNVYEMNLGMHMMEYLFENHYSILVISTFLQSLIQAVVMILGFNKGYKKREADRTKMMTVKQDQM